MILVTGATGSVGSAVVRELIDRRVAPVRAMYRNRNDREKVPAGAEAVAADFSDPPSLAGALDGVDAAYLVCAPVPQLVELETNFLHACRDAKTPNVVINSALGAGDFAKSFPSWHRKVEDEARRLSLPATILRPNGFMQNIGAYMAPTIRTQDAFYATIGAAAISFIDVRDVASAAAETLLSKRWAGQVFELSGSEAVTYEELAGRISRKVGRPIKYVNLTPGQMRQAMTGAGVPDWQATALLELEEYYQSGKGAASDESLRQLLGRPPRTLDGYLTESASQFRKPS